MNSIKKSIQHEVLSQLELKIQEILNAVISAEESRDADTKSSAGDKHETSRAKIQTEIDQLSGQLFNAKKQKNDLSTINFVKSFREADIGSLIETNRGNYFISIGWGRIEIDNEDYFVISLGSPIGRLLQKLKKGDEFKFRNLDYTINNIY